MKSKLKFIIPLLLVLAGGAYKFVLAKPTAAKADKPKVAGEVYVLPTSFLLNLKDGKFGKLGVALVLAHGYSAAPAAGGAHEGAATTPPDGYGTLPQEAIVRSIVTDVVTDSTAGQLESRKGRGRLTRRILKRIRSQTDVKVDHVLLTDVAIQ